MKQLLNFITLGVDDLDKMRNFYTQQFGWTPMRDSDGIIFFKLNGFILSLYPNKELAEDAGVPHERQGFKGFTLAICFNSEKEVDDIFASLEKKGVKIIKAPQKVFWGGYSGYIEDIEGNLWELAYNPFLELDAKGNCI